MRRWLKPPRTLRPTRAGWAFFALTLGVGLSALNVPFKGGMLGPNPDALFPLPIDGAGNILLSTFWDPAIPGAFTTYFQYWIPDAAAINGFAASNGLSATTP